ncbi:ComEC/Rec2 family competence protein [Lutibacter sp.]|uniref:ComEC/Rec2 family competence protein n=1 Tax=Lutibacter sp. TaxID=1925666 RepID=UPI002733CC86|nr:ComEC/Rec2 family competence protein [Lutibacter sp.]MDP3313495.1 ComEC/Rec2 family competence protein [Lutibacter sp.]
MRRLLKFIPVSLTFFLILGILVGNYYQFSPKVIAIVAIAIVIIFSVVFYVSEQEKITSNIFIFGFFICFFFIGISAVVFKNQINQRSHYTNNNNFSKNENVSSSFWIAKKLKSNANYYKYEAEISAIGTEKAKGRILLLVKINLHKNELEIGSNYNLNAKFNKIPELKNPFGFNYKKYLKNQQIHHQVYTEFSNLIPLNYKSEKTLSSVGKFRETIIKKLAKNGFKNNELAVISALLLGEKTTISDELLQDYSKSGAIHILAVSGLHVGLLLLILNFLFRPLHSFKNGKTYAVIAVVILLWMYALIAGLSASVVRAVTMFTALAIGMQLNRPTNVYNTLVVSMFILLLINPFYLFEIGFQMSYIAVFSIVWIQPKLMELWYPRFWLTKKVWQLLTVSVAAQMGVLPLSLLYFHQFPGLFFVSNLVVIPFLGFVLGLGLLVIVLAMLNFLPFWLGELLRIILQKMNFFIEWVASHEQFVITNISISFAITITSYLIIISFFKWVEVKKYVRFLIFCISVLIFQSILFYEKYNLEVSNELIIFHKNKASLIIGRNGNNIQLMSSDIIIEKRYEIDSYLLGIGVKDIEKLPSMSNSFVFGETKVVVINDANEVGNINSSTILLLQKSPKINLERLLKTYKPKIIIADGSNYKSYSESWEQTCLKNKTPFHSTMQKGAFIFQY